jgi:hypothetical protein
MDVCYAHHCVQELVEDEFNHLFPGGQVVAVSDVMWPHT